MKKILFGITGLTLGGAERVLVDIANNLCDKYEITIFTRRLSRRVRRPGREPHRRRGIYLKWQSVSACEKRRTEPPAWRPARV